MLTPSLRQYFRTVFPFRCLGHLDERKQEAGHFFAHQKFSKLPNYLIHLKGECGEIFKPRLFRQPKPTWNPLKQVCIWNLFHFYVFFYRGIKKSFYDVDSAVCSIQNFFSRNKIQNWFSLSIMGPGGLYLRKNGGLKSCDTLPLNI